MTDIRIGSPLRDASVDPRPEDFMPMREVDGHPGVFKHAILDEPEYLAAVAERRAQKNPKALDT